MSKVAARLKSAKNALQGRIGGRYACYIPAGKATGGPPLGTELGKLGVNIPAFVKDFNDKTKHMKEGLPIGCEVDVNPDRSYQLTLSSPPMTYFLFQAAGITSGARNKNRELAGLVTLKHCYEIAKIKKQDFYFSHQDLEVITKKVISAARTMGIKVVPGPIDPTWYAKYLEKRKVIVEKRLEASRLAKESRLLRLS